MIDAYLAALPPGVAPRILASRSVFIADDRADAWHFAGIGLRSFHARLVAAGRAPAQELSLEALVARQDVHLGNAADVVASLRADRVAARATDLAVQVHSVDPPHEFTLRSIELMAREVAPALGWCGAQAAPARRAA